MEEFTHVAEELGLMDDNGSSSCYRLRTNDSDDIIEDSNCSLVYSVCRDLILETGLTTEGCLAGNATAGGHEHEHGDDEDDDDVSESEG